MTFAALHRKRISRQQNPLSPLLLRDCIPNRFCNCENSSIDKEIHRSCRPSPRGVPRNRLFSELHTQAEHRGYQCLSFHRYSLAGRLVL